MRFFGPDEVAAALPWAALIESLEDVFLADNAVAPERTVHQVEVPGRADSSLLLKPGWLVGDVIAVKVVTFFPENGDLDLATINAGVLLFSAVDGTLLGACDGNVLTAMRTPAASAVAAKRLARTDAKNLLVVGTGALSPMTAKAHSAVRSYERIEIWGRSADKAQAVVDALAGSPDIAAAEVVVSPDLDASVANADVITCVTGATSPLVKGALLKDGAHVDLIGSFTPTMRESDDDAVRRARVWVDTIADGSLAGDIAQPLEAGILKLDDIQGDLAQLVAGTCPVRATDAEITLFKSAGTALEDVAAAKLVFG